VGGRHDVSVAGGLSHGGWRRAKKLRLA
jgi:hypothetical protein